MPGGALNQELSRLLLLFLGPVAQLGEGFADVQRRVGIFEPDAKPGSGAPVEDYAQPSRALLLWIRDKKVAGISHDCWKARARLNRISCRAPERRIKEVFGAEIRVMCAQVADNDPRKADAAFARAYDVLSTGTRYVVERGRVTAFILMAPEDLRSREGGLWHRCEKR